MERGAGGCWSWVVGMGLWAGGVVVGCVGVFHSHREEGGEWWGAPQIQPPRVATHQAPPSVTRPPPNPSPNATHPSRKPSAQRRSAIPPFPPPGLRRHSSGGLLDSPAATSRVHPRYGAKESPRVPRPPSPKSPIPASNQPSLEPAQPPTSPALHQPSIAPAQPSHSHHPPQAQA